MLTERPGVEIFEAKVHHDPRFPWPDSDTMAAVLEARSVLHDVGMRCLRALVKPLGLDWQYLESILDGPSPPLTTCSNSTMRVWHYPPDGAGSEMHCDNTLLTIAPAGSRIGLGIRRFRDNSSCFPEEQMTPGAVLVFAGDALSYLTAGRLPACVHWVTPATDCARISMPFFLRARRDAKLNPPPEMAGRVEPLVQHDIDGGDRSCSLSGCTNEGSKTCGACGMARYCCVEHQQLDWTKGGHMRTCGKNKVSKRWPWKLDKYYAGVPGQPCGRGVVPFEDPSL